MTVEYLKGLTVNKIQNGPFPLKAILQGSLYYPACDIDGELIRYCNMNFDRLHICSYVYADYAVGQERLMANLDSFLGYHLISTRELSPTDVCADRGFPMPKGINPEEYRRYQDQWQAFGQWAIYERDEDYDGYHGPECFSLLYLGAEGVATYAGLYLNNDITPKGMAIIQPGHAFGFNWTNFTEPNGPFTKTIKMGRSMPEYLFYGGNGLHGYNQLPWPGYEQVDRKDHYYPTVFDSAMTVWQRNTVIMNENVYKGLLSLVSALWNDSNDLKSLYNASIDCPFLPPAAKERISQQTSNYAQNVLLKKELSDIMNGHYDINDYNLAFWIINTWGGISRFKKNKINKRRIQNFITSLPTGETTLERISSLSKVASFLTPSCYFVYDSRVAYSLNWLLLKAGAKSGFFFKPRGQNKKLNHFPIEKIIHKEVPGNNVYLKKDITYDSYNKLIIKLYNDISKNAKDLKHAFELEMLLFQAAPRVIYQEILRKYSGTDFTSSSVNTRKTRKKALVNAFTVPGTYVVDAVYRHNSNGRQLVYPQKLSSGIIECWEKGGEVKLILDGQEISVKRKSNDYGVFRQTEVNSWAKNKEDQNTINDKDTIPVTVILSLPDSSQNE